MTSDRIPSPASTGAGTPRAVLIVVWVFTALAVGVLSYLLLALSDRSDERLAGWVLLGVALLGGVVAAVLISGRQTRRLSLVASTLVVLGGAAASLIVLADGRAFASDLLLLCGIPAAGGLATGLLALRTRR